MEAQWNDTIDPEEYEDADVSKASEIILARLSKAFKCNLEVIDLFPFAIHYMSIVFSSRYAAYTLSATSNHIGDFLMFVTSPNYKPFVSVYYNFPCMASLAITDSVLSSIANYLTEMAIEESESIIPQRIDSGVLKHNTLLPLDLFVETLLDYPQKVPLRAVKEISTLHPILQYLRKSHDTVEIQLEVAPRPYMPFNILLSIASITCDKSNEGCSDCINSEPVTSLIDPINMRVGSVRGLDPITMEIARFHITMEQGNTTANLRKYIE